MNKKYLVRLSETECRVCGEVVPKLKGSSEKVRRARVLLKADADGPGWTDEKLAEAHGGRVQTVEHVRRRFVGDGFELALERVPRQTPPTAPLLAGEAKAKAKVIATRWGESAGGVRSLNVAVIGQPRRRAGDRRVDPSRNCPTGVQTNGLTKRKIAYWIPQLGQGPPRPLRSSRRTGRTSWKSTAPLRFSLSGGLPGRAAGAVDR